jgi:hypothetical protein
MKPFSKCVRTLLVFHYFFNKLAGIADVKLIKGMLSIADYRVDFRITEKMEMS